MNSIIDTLTTLPLFTGVSRERMTEVVGASKFHFMKYAGGELLIQPGTRCNKLVFVLSGRIRLKTTHTDHNITVEQTLTAPNVVMPEFLFGKATHFPFTATALSAVNAFEVGKADYLNILKRDDIFMFNYLNYLSSRSQQAMSGILDAAGTSTLPRLIYAVSCLTQNGATDIAVNCGELPPSQLLGTGARETEDILTALSRGGIATLRDNTIHIADRRRLLEYAD